MMEEIVEEKGCKDIKVEIIEDYLGYATLFGIENNDEMKRSHKARRLLFVNMGDKSLNVSCCEYEEDKCIIKSYKYSKRIGGHKIDKYIIEDVKKMIEEEDNKIESRNGDRVYYRIMYAIIKMKEKLSAQGADTINLHIDQILEDDEDYDGEYSLDRLNEVLSQNNVWKEIKELLDECIKESDWDDEKLKDLEICTIGGSMRISNLKEELIKYLKEKSNGNNENLTLTLNMDDCISQGNSYYGLIKYLKDYGYEVDDESDFKREENKNDGLSENKISEYWEDIKEYKKRDLDEVKKASKRNEIEKIKY